MDNKKIARELLKLAKDLTSAPKFEKAMRNLKKDVLDASPIMGYDEDDNWEEARIENVLYLIKEKDEDALSDTLMDTMGRSKSKYDIRSEKDVVEFAKYLIENRRKVARSLIGFDYYRFHSKGDLHRNVLLNTLEDEHGLSFRDYDLSPTGIKAKNSKTEKVLKKLFAKKLIGGLYDPGLQEAYEFVFSNYAKIYSKWAMTAFKTKKPQPKLLPVLKRVTKKFNSYGKPSSQFTVDELKDGYFEYQMKGKSKGAKGYDESLAYYGLNTL